MSNMGAGVHIVEASYKELKYILDYYRKSKEILRLNQTYILRVVEVGNVMFHAELIDPANGLPSFGHLHMPIQIVSELVCLSKDNSRARLDRIVNGGPLPDGTITGADEEPSH